MTLLIHQNSEHGNAGYGRYSVNFQKAYESISLTISALQLEDSAKYFCALRELSSMNGQQKEKSDQQQVKQSPRSLTVQEGEISILNCSCEKSTINCFLWYQQYPGSGVAQSVTQDQPDIVSEVGKAVTLNCRYETSWDMFRYYIFWYKQIPSGQMTYLIRQYSDDGNARDGRYSVNFQKAHKSISLTISALELEDSAKYFCLLLDSQCLK
ncbi:hypothetical protein E5288_WYG004584 [Bos mutus]|uniref:Ig-like domain-containing protein n=2 Tax=Bos TaxID=9903 RepID=A0A6B0SBZ5_9CETA|nr:hypothetical protein [Bos mutus]